MSSSDFQKVTEAFSRPGSALEPPIPPMENVTILGGGPEARSLACLLRPAGEGADMPSGRDGMAHCRAAHEAGRAGHREHGFHSRTIWSRWTIALRGA